AGRWRPSTRTTRRTCRRRANSTAPSTAGSGPRVMGFEFPFQDPGLPIDARVDDLVARLTLEEKASQMLHEAQAIDRLGIPAYNWWNEALHGVARAGVATVFPQAIGLAAMWNAERLHEVATA